MYSPEQEHMMQQEELVKNEAEQETVSFEIEDDQPQQVEVSEKVEAAQEEPEEKTSTIVQNDDDSELENYSE